MRSFILRSCVALLALALPFGGALAQTKKKRKTKAAKTSASKTTTAATTTTTPAQPYTGDPVPPPQLPEQGDGVQRIGPAEAHAAADKGTAIIIDVRGAETYKMGHIKGSLSIPVNEFIARIKELPRDKMIITYCS